MKYQWGFDLIVHKSSRKGDQVLLSVSLLTDPDKIGVFRFEASEEAIKVYEKIVSSLKKE